MQGRLWTVLLTVLAALLGLLGVLLEREFAAIDKRLDRITDYILEQHR